MSRVTGSLPAVLLFLVLNAWASSAAWAQTDVVLSGTIKLFSSFYTQDSQDDAFIPHEQGEYALTRSELQVGLSGYVSENVSFRSKVFFTSLARDDFDDLQDLESYSGYSSAVHENDVYVREAFFTVQDLAIEGLDLSAGRQRVRWGTSDEYNVVDNLNPVDYRNLLSFDPDYQVEHLAMDGLNLEYQLPFDFDVKLQAVYFFSFKPSTLPVGFTAQSGAVLQSRLDALTSGYGFTGGDVDLVVRDIPDYRVAKGPVGLRMSGIAYNFDWGFSYYRGYQSLPLIYRLETDIAADSSRLASYYDYPRLDVVGFDLSGEVSSVGVWAEFGAYFPEDRDVVVATTLMSTPNVQSFPLLEDAYYKYTLGFDYTFGIGNGLYWNTQFNHGYYDELDYTSEADTFLGLGNPGFTGTLGDYYITRFEYSFFHDTLTLTLDALLEVAEYEDFSNNTATVFKPDVEYKPYDNVSLELGYVMISGARGTKYGGFEDHDVLYVLLKAYF